MEEAQGNANEYENDEGYDGFREQLLNKRDLYAEQLAKTIDDIGTIEKIKVVDLMTEVAFGAIVVTDFQKLFISLGLGKVVVDGEVFFAISTAVPVYSTMAGLKKGDVYEFNNRKFKILDIY